MHRDLVFLSGNISQLRGTEGGLLGKFYPSRLSVRKQESS